MPPRRTVLRAAGWVGLSAVAGIGLAGCGIRLEDDAPPIPFVSRQPIPDEALLVAAYRRATALAGVAGRATGVPLAPEVAQRHTRQAQVLRAILDAGQVPERIISGPPGSTATATSGSTGTSDGTATTTSTSAPTNAVRPPVTAEELARAARDTADASIAATGSFVTQRALGVAIAAHDAAGAASLAAPPVWPSRDPLPAPVATPLVEVTRACEYALEVAAAHLLDTDREALLATVAALTRREAALAAALTPNPLPALGYHLPFPVTGPGDARRLVSVVLRNLVDRGLDDLDRIPQGSSGLLEVVRLEAEAVTLAVAHGVAWPTMPGLALG